MGGSLSRLAVPEHFDPGNAYKVEFYVKDTGLLRENAETFAKKHNLRSCLEDKLLVHLLIIDAQVDFSFPEGALFVAGRSGKGAMEANGRLASFIYSYLHVISRITCTLDTHNPLQIFFPSAHLTEDGNHPSPHTIISSEDYRKGVYKPSPILCTQLRVTEEWLTKQFIHYLEELEKTGKYQLYLWPYHCIVGSNGHRLAGVIDEARLFHSFARKAPNSCVLKGSHPLTENYSVFSPEVTTRWDGGSLGKDLRNQTLLDELLKADMILIAGLASSHCVKESVSDLLKEIESRDPKMAQKVYLLEDCTAPVVVPGGPDFTEEAKEAFERFQRAGMHVVKSTDPMETWPQVPF